MESIWKNWSTSIRRWGFQNFIVWLLEAAEPAHVLGAQMIYVGQPLLVKFVSNGQIQALASLLEEPEQAHAFAEYLREDQSEFR